MIRSVPRTLTEMARWADPATTALLLGAGASVPSGAPTADRLKDLLLQELGQEPSKRDLATTAEILEGRLGRRPLIEAVRRILQLEPTGGLSLLPSLPWRAIYTTNYDTLVEQAAGSRQIPYIRIRSRFDFPGLEKLGHLRLFKLHGCITQDHAFGDPSSLVLTRGDYRRVRSWKSELLQRMQVDMETARVLVIGHSLADPHLDELIEQVNDLQQAIGFRERVGLLLYEDDPELIALYESRGILCTVGGIDEFMNYIASRQATASPLAGRVALHDGIQLPDRLISATLDIGAAIRVVSPIRKMFGGSPATYHDISAGRTFARSRLVSAVLERLLNSKVAVILGRAGLGKTTLARQCLLALREDGFFVWEHRPDLPLDPESWASVDGALREAGQYGVLLVDGVSSYQRSANDLCRLLGPSRSRALHVLATADRHRWRALVKHRDFISNRPIELGRLNRDEIVALVTLTEESEDVRSLIPTDFLQQTRTEQLDFLTHACAGDIFVCLRNVFASASFDSIVLEEFNQLDEQSQEIYRLTAGLEAVAGASHRQLILRMLDLRGDEVSSVVGDLEGLLSETIHDNIEGIYVWRTRHPEIARIITKYKFADPESHLSLIQRLVSHINSSVDIERLSIRGLCNNTFGLDSVRMPADRIRLYDQLVDLLPFDHVLRHRLVREFLRLGEVVDAENTLERAIRDLGLDPPLQRYRVELLRTKVRLGHRVEEQDRLTHLRWAREEARRGIDKFHDNWYAYRTWFQVAMDWLELSGDRSWLQDAVGELNDAYERLYEPELARCAERGQRLLDRPGPSADASEAEVDDFEADDPDV
jgi:hypothetical protein